MYLFLNLLLLEPYLLPEFYLSSNPYPNRLSHPPFPSECALTSLTTFIPTNLMRIPTAIATTFEFLVSQPRMIGLRRVSSFASPNPPDRVEFRVPSGLDFRAERAASAEVLTSGCFLLDSDDKELKSDSRSWDILKGMWVCRKSSEAKPSTSSPLFSGPSAIPNHSIEPSLIFKSFIHSDPSSKSDPINR